MVFAFNFPDLGEGIHEGKLVRWLVKEGDAIKADQIIAEVETDKAVVELPSPASGTLLKKYFEEGQVVHLGQIVVAIGSQGEAVPPQHAGSAQGESVKVVPVSAPSPSETHVPGKINVSIVPSRPSLPLPVLVSASRPSFQSDVQASTPAGAVLATPATRAFARELGVDLTKVKGSGPGGRIMPEDVKRFSQQGGSPAQVQGASTVPTGVVSAAPAAQGFEYPKVSFTDPRVERVPLTPLRKAIAQKMVDSNRWLPQVTHFDEADVTRLEELRQASKTRAQEQGVKLTLLPFVAKAALNALVEFPEFNSSIDVEKQELVLRKYYNLGIAVETPEGLIVVSIKDAQKKGVWELASEIQSLAGKARERKASLEEVRGSTFTITNIGSVAGTGATPLVNFPEAAILGLFRAKDKPVVREGQVVVRKMMPLCVSFDHRVIDGAAAARFTATIVRQLEDPATL